MSLPRRDPRGGMKAPELEIRRMRALELLKSGMPQVKVAYVLGVTRTSVCRWHKAISRGGSLQATVKQKTKPEVVKPDSRPPHIAIPDLSENDRRRFWSHVDIRGANECWPWMSNKLPFGHGLFKCKTPEWKNLVAPRVACTLGNGTFDNSLDVLHSCDYAPCCNPSHLSPGTHQKNMEECVQRGRIAVGERSSKAKLSDGDIPKIREMYTSGIHVREIAALFGVSDATISSVSTGKTWSHVPARKGEVSA